MKITVNGQSQKFEKERPLDEIIATFSKEYRHVIAELNGNIIKSPAWRETSVKEGDTIELVTIVGGG